MEERTPRTVGEVVLVGLGGASVLTSIILGMVMVQAGENVDYSRDMVASVASGDVSCKKVPPDYRIIECNGDRMPVPGVVPGVGDAAQLVSDYYRQEAATWGLYCAGAGLVVMVGFAGSAACAAYAFKRS